VQPQDERWMMVALQLAKRAAGHDEVPVGAVLVLDDQAVGEGYNCTITDSDPTAHAEIAALRDGASKLGNYRLPGTTLYATVEPCTMCAGAIVHARVARLVYGAGEPKAGAVSSRTNVLDHPAMNHRVQVTGGVLGEQCASVISAFFKEKRL
tara:strand:+ start:868 stop:1323 length:456 start_codon:yes stop_codon:yes gene_type:complete